MLPMQAAEGTRLGTHGQRAPGPQVCAVPALRCGCSRAQVLCSHADPCACDQARAHVTLHTHGHWHGRGTVFPEPLAVSTDARPHASECPGGGPAAGGRVPSPDVTASHGALPLLCPQSPSPPQPLQIGPAVRRPPRLGLTSNPHHRPPPFLLQAHFSGCPESDSLVPQHPALPLPASQNLSPALRPW